MDIRRVNKNEYKALTEIHLNAFSGFFLTSLGRGFLDTYYKACLKSKNCISICAIDKDNVIQGFCIGSKRSRGYHKHLLIHNFFSFCIQGIIIVITNLNALLRLVMNIEKNSNSLDNGDYAELLSIAVSISNKGKGLGKLLINNFEVEAKSLGCKKIALTTDFFDNEDVISFYRSTGYEIFYKFTTYPNREMYKLIKYL